MNFKSHLIEVAAVVSKLLRNYCIKRKVLQNGKSCKTQFKEPFVTPKDELQ